MTVQMLEAMKGCGNLDSLELDSCQVRQQDATLFWNSIAQVKTLKWKSGGGIIPDWRLTARDPPESSPSLHALHPTAPHSSLREIKVINHPLEMTDLRIFGHCHDLCRIQWLGGKDVFPIIFADLDLWPQLREFEVCNKFSKDLSDERWIRILTSQRGQRMESLKIERYYGTIVKTSITFVAGSGPQETGIRPRITETLTSLDLMPCTRLSGAVVQGVLTSLRALKVLCVRRIGVMDIVQGAEWVCRNLQHLYIDIDMTPDNDQSESSDLFQVNQRLVFERLSTLTELQTLTLHRVCRELDSPNYRGLDLSLTAGLDALASLTKLSWLLHYIPRNMVLADVEWMVKSWPGLKVIRSRLTNDPPTYYVMKRLLNDHNVAILDPGHGTIL